MREKKTKKGLWYTLLLTGLALTALLVSMTMMGCKGGKTPLQDDPDHVHDFSNMNSDAGGHWKSCPECGKKQNAEAHVYKDSAKTCSVCGYARPAHDHQWAKKWSSDQKGHWISCTVAGCTALKSYSEHGNNPYSNDENRHWMDCIVCGAEYVIENHRFHDSNDSVCDTCGYVRNVAHKVHHWELARNSIQHWQRCSVCNMTRNHEKHKFAFRFDNYNHWQTCSICGESRSRFTTPHDYKWKSDTDGHWKECICGSKIEKGTHVYDNASDPTCNTCGYTRHIHDHLWSTDWKQDEGHHWHTCTVEDCTEIKDYGAHIYTWKPGVNGHFGECVCGATTETENHVYDNDWDSTCNTCGYVRYIYVPDPVVPPHTDHNWIWTYDDNHHWEKCSECGDMKPNTTPADHSYDNGRYANNGTEHWQICDVCEHRNPNGIVENHQTPTSWIFDENNHWYQCACGLITEQAAHQSDGTWQQDNSDHWQACTVCFQQLLKEPHTYENGICTVCGVAQ